MCAQRSSHCHIFTKPSLSCACSLQIHILLIPGPSPRTQTSALDYRAFNLLYVVQDSSCIAAGQLLALKHRTGSARVVCPEAGCSLFGLDNMAPLRDVDSIQKLPDVLVAHVALVVDERCAL